MARASLGGQIFRLDKWTYYTNSVCGKTELSSLRSRPPRLSSTLSSDRRERLAMAGRHNWNTGILERWPALAQTPGPDLACQDAVMESEAFIKQ